MAAGPHGRHGQPVMLNVVVGPSTGRGNVITQHRWATGGNVSDIAVL